MTLRGSSLAGAGVAAESVDRRQGDGLILFAMTHSAAGGLREIWSDIAQGLGARGHKTGRFVLYPPDDAAAEQVDWQGWHHIAARRPRSPLGGVVLFCRLVGYLRRTRPDAVVTAMPAANVVVPLAVWLAGLPTRVFVSHHSPTQTHHRLLDLIDGWTGTLRCVAGVVSVSDAVAATLAHKPAGYRAKRRTIHNALPESIEQLIDALSPTERARRIVALGRLTFQKNYPLMLRAVARVAGVMLEIVGGGEDEADLRALAADLGISDRVAFSGLMPRADALARVAGAALFVQVSRYEGHSLALIEAARLGLPLIVSDIPEQIEAITTLGGTRCGIAVALDDVDALARHIAALVDDRDARAYWSALARQVATERSNGEMIDHYERMLVEAAGSRYGEHAMMPELAR